jgi:hypothetical protein
MLTSTHTHLLLVLVAAALLAVGAASPSAELPCDQPLNVTLSPDPTMEITRGQVEEANNFLELLLSNSSMPFFNTSLDFSVSFAATVHELVELARSYRGQTIDTLARLREVALFSGSGLKTTYLATLKSVYKSYQAAANQPAHQAQIKARFVDTQKQWLTAAAGQTSATTVALGPWQLSASGQDAYRSLRIFFNTCQVQLPLYIGHLEKLIAQLKSGCGECPALDKAERDLAAALADLTYCWQGALPYASTLLDVIGLMKGDLWGKVLSLMHVVVDDLGSASDALGQLDLDDIIFDLNLAVAVRSWTGVELEAYSTFYYGCLNGLIPADASAHPH